MKGSPLFSHSYMRNVCGLLGVGVRTTPCCLENVAKVEGTNEHNELDFDSTAGVLDPGHGMLYDFPSSESTKRSVSRGLRQVIARTRQVQICTQCCMVYSSKQRVGLIRICCCLVSSIDPYIQCEVEVFFSSRARLYNIKYCLF